MCAALRKTDRRGRAAVPRTFALTLRWRRRRDEPFAILLICSYQGELCGGACLRGLTGLALDDFVRVLDALALVGFRLLHAADLGRDFTDALLVDARHRDDVLIDSDVD